LIDKIAFLEAGGKSQSIDSF